jgi:hypothetical protein
MYLTEKCVQFQYNPKENKYNIKMHLIKLDKRIWLTVGTIGGRGGIVVHTD